MATRGGFAPSQTNSVAHRAWCGTTGGIKTNFKRENRERSAPQGMNNAMIDKNIQLLERDNEQDTGEEKSNVSTAETLPGSFMLKCVRAVSYAVNTSVFCFH